MKISLALDTATNRTIMALLNGDQLIWSESHDGATEHTETLIKLITEATKKFKNIDQVIVGMGPGPFTGLRAGIAFAQSFAFARGLPIFGVCSLDAIAAPINDEEFIVATDARRKEIYWARYLNGKRVGDPQVTSITELPKLPIFGEGAFKYLLTTDVKHAYPKLISFPHLQNVNQPMYLRHPDAVPPKEFKSVNS